MAVVNCESEGKYKLVLVGEAGVGKTTFTKGIRTYEFDKKYVATLGVEVHPVKLSSGPQFAVWDTAGQDKFGGLRWGYYKDAVCAMVMHDLTDPETFAQIPKWIADVKNTCGDIPIVVVGTKSDLTKDVRRELEGYANFTVSTKKAVIGGDYTEVLAPFRYLASQLN